MIETFFQSMMIGYSGAIMPGSMLTYTIDKSLRHGTRSGLIISLGHSLLELVLVLLIFAGAGRFLGTEAAKTVIGLAGGLVLVYLGAGMLLDVYRNRIQINLGGESSGKQGNMLLGGAVVSASNPFFILWWTAVGLALIMNAYNAFGIAGIVVFYIGHILADITWFTFIAALVSKSRNLFNLKVYRVVIALLALCLIAFGLNFFIGSIRIWI